jgi:outer membrane protein OmpA-like peptidoglycan-associated protein
MTEGRSAGVVLAAVAAALVAACGPRHVRTAPPPVTSRDQVVLLPDAENAVVGRAAVSNTAGAVDLTTARSSTIVATNQAPTPPTELTEAEVKRLFGDVLATLPPAPQHFTLYFRFESDELTDESRALIEGVLQTVKRHPAPDVVVVGHTDTAGTSPSNRELGMKRATMVGRLLLSAGVDPASLAIASHGEADLLVATRDDVPEPRNRRVEVTVR